MRITAILLAVVLSCPLWLSANGSLSEADPVPSSQIEKLKTLGARITFDDQKRVTVVNFGERRVTDADLVHLKGLEHLQELDLTRTRITSAGLAHVKGLTTLQRLFLTETKVDDTGLTHLKGMKSLALIGLSGTKISDAGLDNLRELTGLKYVYCLATSVTDDGVKKLQQALPNCRVAH